MGDTKKAHRSRSGFWFGIIILVIVFTLAGIGFYLFQQLRDQQTGLGGEVKGELSKKIGDYQSQLVAIQSQLAALETDIAGKDSHFTKTLADFSQLHNQKLDATHKELTDAIQQVQRQLGKTRGDWLIADAEYLLSIANERLHLIGDVNTTREALEAADQRLRESGDAAAFKVREQISKEIAALRTITLPDIVGMYSSIQTLEDEVEKLSLLLPYSGRTVTPAKDDVLGEKDKSKKANNLLDSAMSEIEGIVTIRRTDQPIKAVLTPEEARFIREQLRVKLEIIKIALVQHNDSIFQSSITDAKKWLEQHFNQNSEANNLADELNRLAAIKIRNQFPDISMSLKMLRDITKLRIETDKAMKPVEVNPADLTSEPAEDVKSDLTSKPVETIQPDLSTKPAETTKKTVDAVNPAATAPEKQ
ncbi:MAG: enzyme of heme biosynthesis [Methylococcaceae bacterium]|nr:enzyme of heme biosynthesis [Methylococcaceae bacterium]